MHQVAHYVSVLRAPVEGPDWIHVRGRLEAATGLGTLFRRFPGQIGGWRSAVIEELIAELAHPHHVVRGAAIVSLERICVEGDTDERRAVVERLVPLLGDPLWMVRDRVLLAIGRIGPAPVRDLLLARLEEPSARWRAAEALGGMRTADPEVLAALCAHLPDGSIGSRVALALAAQAEVCGAQAVVAAVRPSLSDPAPAARANGLRVMVEIGAPGWVGLCADAMADPAVEVRVRAVSALATAGERWDLLGAAAHDDRRVRVALGGSLTRADGAEPLLLHLLADSDHPVRSAAWSALVKRPDSLEAVRKALALDDPAVRREAAKRLGDLGGRSDVDRLRALCDDPDRWVRRQAVVALPRLVSRLRQRTRGLRQWLGRVLVTLQETDPEPEVRAAAEKARTNLSISA